MLPVQCVAVSETLSDVATVHSPRAAHEARDDDVSECGDVAGDCDVEEYERDARGCKSLIRVHTVNGRFVGEYARVVVPPQRPSTATDRPYRLSRRQRARAGARVARGVLGGAGGRGGQQRGGGAGGRRRAPVLRVGPAPRGLRAAAALAPAPAPAPEPAAH